MGYVWSQIVVPRAHHDVPDGPMDDPLNNELAADAPTSLDESRALYLTALPVPAPPRFDLTHPYFEIVYTPSLGPSAVALGRHLGRLLAAHEVHPVMVCPAALAKELGMRASSEDPLGSRSRLRRAIDRLEHGHIVRWIEPQLLGILPEVSAVSDRVRDRLPDRARRTHDHFINQVIDLRGGHRERPTARAPTNGERARHR